MFDESHHDASWIETNVLRTKSVCRACVGRLCRRRFDNGDTMLLTAVVNAKKSDDIITLKYCS
jgi:hypothetical protein